MSFSWNENHPTTTTATAALAADHNSTNPAPSHRSNSWGHGGRTTGMTSSSATTGTSTTTTPQNTTTTMDNPHPQPPHAQAPTPQIQHAGRAHVRGKIRRIWRPRYMELWDHGLVRYYELPACADISTTQPSDGDHVNMIPKYTLQIFEARILDVTTLRDMHTGLPRGAFGFCFRGQRLLHLEAAYVQQQQQQQQQQGCMAESSAVKEQRDFLCAVSRLEEAQMWVVALQWAAQQQQQWCWPYSPGASPGSSTHGGIGGASSSILTSPLSLMEPWWNTSTTTPTSRTATPPPLLPGSTTSAPRLQPAPRSTAATTTTPTTTTTTALSWDPNSWEHTTEDDSMMGVQVLDNSVQWSEIGSPTTTTSSTTITRRRTVPATEAVSSTSARPSSAVTNTASVPSTTRSTTTTTAPTLRSSPFTTRSADHYNSTATGSNKQQQHVPPAGGKMVVCRVAQYRTVRISTFGFEIAYEIHGMLLRNKKAEQWSMLRTARDLQILLQQLHQELNNTSTTTTACTKPTTTTAHSTTTTTKTTTTTAAASSTQSILDRLTSSVRQLPRLADRPSRQALQESMTVMDQLLRTLVMDGTMVNTTACKSFLGISTTTNNNNNNTSCQQHMATSPRALSLRFWKWHNHQAVLFRKTVLLHESMPTDQFVKQWLQDCLVQQQQHQSVVDAQAALVLQRPVLWLGGLGGAAAAAIFGASSRVLPTVSVRLDVLVVSWIGAAYLGSWYQQQQQQTGATIRTSRSRTAAKSSRPIQPPPTSLSASSTGDGVVVSRDGVLLPDIDSGGGGGVVDAEDDDDEESDGEETGLESSAVPSDSSFYYLPSPLPKFPANDGRSCWSQPPTDIFHVRGANYFKDKVKIPSGLAPLTCRGVDVWMTDSPERNISRHPSVLGGTLAETDTFLVNFLLPFGNLVAYFCIPALAQFPKNLQSTWTNFLKGDQSYRDARLKLLPVVCEGPWIVKAAVGPGKSPALLGKVIPLQYFFRDPTKTKKGVYEVDVIITASSIAKSILSVVKGHTKTVSIAFAFIIEGARQEELPETVLCCFQLHPLHLEHCPMLPVCNLDDDDME